jgi:hypothetical protein
MGVFNMGVKGDLKKIKVEFLKNCSVTFFYFGMELPWDGIDDL